MPTLRADVAIIGGGLVGCAAALSLARAGLAVTILDQGVCGSQASGVNAGGVRQQGRDPVELPLARRARALWDQLPELIGADVEFEAKGHLKLARSEAHMAELERYAKIAVPCGLKLELLGRNAVRAAYPFLGPAVVGASLCRDDGQANPRLAAGAFARAARRAGADIHEHQRVSRLSRGPTGFKVICDSGLTVQSAELVNAAGAWGGMIAAQFGETVPIAVMAPNLSVTEALPSLIPHLIGAVGGDIYFTQMKRGNLVFGGGPGWGDTALMRARPIAATTQATIDRAVQCIPGLADVQVIRSWSGIEGVLADKFPVIGPSHTAPGLIHAFGFCGRGFQLGPAVGAVVDELVRTGKTATPIAAFDIGRFGAVGSKIDRP